MILLPVRHAAAHHTSATGTVRYYRQFVLKHMIAYCAAPRSVVQNKVQQSVGGAGAANSRSRFFLPLQYPRTPHIHASLSRYCYNVVAEPPTLRYGFTMILQHSLANEQKATELTAGTWSSYAELTTSNSGIWIGQGSAKQNPATGRKNNACAISKKKKRVQYFTYDGNPGIRGWAGRARAGDDSYGSCSPSQRRGATT